MAIKMTSADLLKNYFNGVLGRADHHAKEVERVALSIMGAVIWKSDRDIEVKETPEGGTGNILWFWSNGNKYALYYNHKTRQIELRDRTMRGETLHKFDNGTTQDEIFDIFSAL